MRAVDLLPGRARAREARWRRRSTAPTIYARPRQLRRLLAPRRRARRRGRLGRSSTSTCARTTPRARRRSRSRSPSSSAGSCPTRSSRRSPPARCSRSSGRASSSSRGSGSSTGERPRLYGGQAEGCAPVARAFAEERRVSPVRPDTVAHSLAIGTPADGDLAIATARASGGAIYAVPEDEVGAEHVAARRDRRHLRRDRAGVTVGALRAAAAARRDRRERPRRRARHRHRPEDAAARSRRRGRIVEIEADVDALLEELGVTHERERSTRSVVAASATRSPRVDVRLARAVNARLELVARAARATRREHGHRAPRPRPRGVAARAACSDANPGPLSRRRASTSSSAFVLDARQAGGRTVAELHRRACPATGSGPR